MLRTSCKLGWAIPLTAAVVCVGQESAPVGIVRGELLAWSGTAARGELVFRNADNRVFQCSFDEHSFFERANERITVAATVQGDRIEVVSDRREGTGICYARTVQVVEVQPVRALPGQRPRLRTVRSATDFFAPRGDLTFAGIVLRVSPEALVLRTRSNEHKTILLRSDTRFLGGGQSLERGSLDVNTRVFIRAGRNFEDKIEAYQIVWGEILQPVIPPQR